MSLPGHLMKIFCLEIGENGSGLRLCLCIPRGWEVALDPLVMAPLQMAAHLMVWEQVGIPILPDSVVLSFGLRKFRLPSAPRPRVRLGYSLARLVIR